MLKNRGISLLFSMGLARPGIVASSIHTPRGSPRQQEPFARALEKNGLPGYTSGTIAMAAANRSCGPPKPGRRLLRGFRWCRRRSAGGSLGLVWVRISIVHRHGTVERFVEPCRVPSCQNRVPTESRRNPIWPDGTRRAPTDHSIVPYQCTTDIRIHTGP